MDWGGFSRDHMNFIFWSLSVRDEEDALFAASTKVWLQTMFCESASTLSGRLANQLVEEGNSPINVCQGD